MLAADRGKSSSSRGFGLLSTARGSRRPWRFPKRLGVRNEALQLVEQLDHSANARNVDLELNLTRLLIFGNPNAGTPLMQSAQTIGIDLPQKMLVFQDAKGLVTIAYNDTAYLAERHGITGQDEIDWLPSVIRWRAWPIALPVLFQRSSSVIPTSGAGCPVSDSSIKIIVDQVRQCKPGRRQTRDTVKQASRRQASGFGSQDKHRRQHAIKQTDTQQPHGRTEGKRAARFDGCLCGGLRGGCVRNDAIRIKADGPLAKAEGCQCHEGDKPGENCILTMSHIG